ncbi:MAG TPA: hypothetical protein PKE47_12805, partial [Verrucomicrobiota bacterium]|nr:hypothetical protein [Verrucomicrobiota bacterium]
RFIGVGPATADNPVFDLDFGGGRPAALVREIGEASGHPVNVIIPAELAETPLPPLNLRSVTVPALFSALQAAGPYGFVTQGPPSHDAVWVFYQRTPPGGFLTMQPPPAPAVPPPPEPPRLREEVRVLNLRPSLNAGLSVEDITTAVRVACEMLPDGGQPKLTFHKETSLLITRGRPDQLQLVERVLSQLDTKPATRAETAPHQMSEELMRRYGLLPGPAPGVPPAAKPPTALPQAESPRP